MKETYIKTRFTNVVNISRIVTIHYYEFDRSFRFDGESHDFWEMVYIDKGQVMVQSNERDILLSQGEVFFHAPNEFHSIRAYESSPHFIIISFVCHSEAMHLFEGLHTTLSENLKPIIAAIIREAEKTYVIPKNNIHLRRLVRKDTAEFGGEQLVKTDLEQLLIFMVRNITKKVQSIPVRGREENHLLALVRQYVEQHINEKIAIADLCSEVGYSKTYLCRIFHEQSGDTIAHYISGQKIETAKDLICEGHRNISEISDLLAFDNPQYFARVFKRVTGMTPSEFRLSLRLPVSFDA